VRRRVVAVLFLALLAAGCGVRSSKPYTANATAPCLKHKGFTAVTTNPTKVGFIAGFAANGGLKATSPTGNVLTIAFTADPTSVEGTEKAFRRYATPFYKRHMQDIMESQRNAVLVWGIAPKSSELTTAQACLAS
jgi:hypothetical protein